MKSHRIFLLLALLFVAINLPAQNLKVIKETDDYILKECDSVFYYTHGMEPKDDFVLDTTKIHKVNGVLKLPLDNGKEVVFRDHESLDEGPFIYYNYKGENKKAGHYLIDESLPDLYYGYLVNTKTGTIDTIEKEPTYSPKYKSYAYCVVHIGYVLQGYLIFKNIKSDNETRIELNHELPYMLNWINEKSFVFYTYDGTKRKYYLVQIKQ